MSTSRIDAWRTAFGQLDDVFALTEHDRQRYLDELAQSDVAAHQQLTALLDADTRARAVGFLELSDSDEAGALLEPGMRVGAYRIERELGAGGTGTVWLARRDDGHYDGEVAMKMLHRHLATGAMRDRFRREATLLGRLAHPHIARILDAGTHESSAYIVLEYVHGQAIDAWCDAHRLSVQERLSLFLEVCRAVAHAHANLIVHRDIKPSNILVTQDGQVKLLDFGIGKLIDADNPALDQTELTRMTGRALTPDYAAPEQILSEPVTTATDVYSLGALLYVLLSGLRPYAAAGPSPARIEQAVLNDEPPTLERAIQLAGDAAAAARDSALPRIRRLLRGDLTNIVSCAMRKQPQQRYSSVLALAEDVRRCIEHEPVQARGTSRLYRVGRFIRRNRVSVAVSAIAVLAIAAALVSAMWQARIATLEAHKATEVRAFLLDIFNANSEYHPDGARARQTTAEELLDIASERILKPDDRSPELRAELMGILGGLNATLDKLDRAETLYRQQLATVEKAFGRDDRRVVGPLLDLADGLIEVEKLDEARALALRAQTLLEAAGEQASVDRARVEHVLGYAAYYTTVTADVDEALQHFSTEVRILERLPPSIELANAWCGLGKAQIDEGRFAETLQSFDRCRMLAEQLRGPRDADVAVAHQLMAAALTRMRRLSEGEAHLNKALSILSFTSGTDSTRVALVCMDLARLQLQQGRYREAAVTFEQVLGTLQAVFGTEDGTVRTAKLGLGRALFSSGDFTRADAVLGQGLEWVKDGRKPHQRVLMSQTRAWLRLDQDRPAEALADIELAQELVATTDAGRGLPTAQVNTTRAEALAALRRSRDAQAALQEAAAILEGNDSDIAYPLIIGVQLAQVSIDLAQGRSAAAAAGAMAAIESLRKREDRATLWALEETAQRRLAQAQLMAGNSTQACASLDASIALREPNAVPQDPRLAQARKLRARCSTT
jgi:serine/threonine-protein kinase